MTAWWFWLAVIVAGLCIVAIAASVDHQRRFELRRLGQCQWLACDLPANGGRFGGNAYCRAHYDYNSYGVTDPL